MADSIAASLTVITWAVRWTRSRSITSMAVIAPTSRTQAWIGTSKLTKFSPLLDELAIMGLSRLVIGQVPPVRRGPSAEGLSHPLSWAARPGAEAVLTKRA